VAFTNQKQPNLPEQDQLSKNHANHRSLKYFFGSLQQVRSIPLVSVLTPVVLVEASSSSILESKGSFSGSTVGTWTCASFLHFLVGRL